MGKQVAQWREASPKKVVGLWVQRGRGYAANVFIVKARGMLTFDATSNMEPLQVMVHPFH